MVVAMARLLLVLPTRTYRAAPFLRAATAVGAEVVVASEEASSLAGFMEGRHLTLDLGSPAAAAERAAEFASVHPVDAVLGVDESSVLTAAHVAARLHLPRHNQVEAVAATRDKRLLRGALAAGGVPQPRFVATTAATLDAEAVVRRLGLPVVAKPVALAASRGVIRADSAADLEVAAARIARLLREECGEAGDPPLLVESFVPGVEVAVEALLVDGLLRVLAILDKPDPLDGPYFEETLLVTPSRLPAAARRRVEEVTAEAVRALGLRHGAVHAELRVGDDGAPVVIEVAARSIGGLCSRVLRFGDNNATLEEVIVRDALDLPLPELRRGDAATGVLMLPTPRAGRLRAVEGLGAARRVPFVEDVVVSVPLGERIVPPPEGDRYLGFVFARADTPDQVENALRSAQQRLHVEIDDGGA
jgi:biotin carboxylase